MVVCTGSGKPKPESVQSRPGYGDQTAPGSIQCGECCSACSHTRVFTPSTARVVHASGSQLSSLYFRSPIFCYILLLVSPPVIARIFIAASICDFIFIAISRENRPITSSPTSFIAQPLKPPHTVQHDQRPHRPRRKRAAKARPTSHRMPHRRRRYLGYQCCLSRAVRDAA